VQPLAKLRRKPRRVVNDGELDSHALAHMRMLYDPCSAELAESVYSGDKGYVNRFKSDFSVGGNAGTVATAIFIYPGAGLMGTIETATPATSQIFTLNNSGVPGVSYLISNASKIRTVASCVVVSPLSSPNNAVGQIHYGVIPANSIISGGSYSINGLLSLCTQRVSAANALTNPLEVKWSPGGFDDRYSQITNDDPSDRNEILIIGYGLTPTTGLALRRIDITEWVPLQNTGIAFDGTATKKSRCDINCVIRNLKRKDSNWWWSLGQKALGGIALMSQAYMSGGLVGVTRKALQFV
jgi:hypothetical protein